MKAHRGHARQSLFPLQALLPLFVLSHFGRDGRAMTNLVVTGMNPVLLPVVSLSKRETVLRQRVRMHIRDEW